MSEAGAFSPGQRTGWCSRDAPSSSQAPAARAASARRQRSCSLSIVRTWRSSIPSPFNAVHASTKHAIEGYSESLDHEVRRFGIRVVLVEPVVTRISFEENLTRADQPMAT